MKSILAGSLDGIGDALTFRMRDFNQLRKEKKVTRGLDWKGSREGGGRAEEEKGEKK